MRRKLALLLSLMLSIGLFAAPAQAHPRHRGERPEPVAGLVVTQSTRGFEQTYDALIEAIEQSPASVVAKVDHAANARDAGLRLPPTREVFFGNPNLGTPLMQEAQIAGIDLPQKMLVWEEHDEVYVGYNGAEYLAARHDLDGDAARASLDRIAGALRTLAAAATGVPADDVGGERPSAQAPLGPVACWPGVRTIRSHQDFDATVAGLTEAIEAGPPNLVFTLDHQANAARVGGELRPTTLLVFGNPKLGTPLMLARRSVGIDLPQKFLVHEDAHGDVSISWNEPRYVGRRHHVRGERQTQSTIAHAMKTLATTAAAGPE